MSTNNTKVTILDKGPIIINSDNIELIHQLGGTEQYKDKVALCRCGYSQNKPFCDGLHMDCPTSDQI